MKTTRRNFIKKTSFSAGAIAFSGLSAQAWSILNEPLAEHLSIHIFSKHLQFLDWSKTGEMAAEMGFSGVDLTVRPKGHVLPEMVKSDLPKAVGDIRAAGSACKMITTSIECVHNVLDLDIIQTAATSGVEYYRTHWFKYHPEKTIDESLQRYKNQVRQLSEVNKKHNIIGYYQNHAGTNVGSSFWEIKQLLEGVDTNYFGTQYDIRHAVAEGGHSWENGLRLLQSYIKGIVLKDFKWGVVKGKWKPINVPIGEGMVDFDRYFKLLKKYQLNPPVSLHLEYDLGGAEKGKSTITVDQKVVFDAMIKDLKAVQKLWREA